MTGYSGDGGRRVRAKRTFSGGKHGGPFSRILAAIFLIVIVLSQCSAAMPLQEGCLTSPAAVRYIAALSEPDASGAPDMDWQNDYLADVPNQCRVVVEAVGKQLAGAYESNH